MGLGGRGSHSLLVAPSILSIFVCEDCHKSRIQPCAQWVFPLLPFQCRESLGEQTNHEPHYAYFTLVGERCLESHHL